MEYSDKVRIVDKWKRSFESTKNFIFYDAKGDLKSIKFTDVCTHKADDLFDLFLRTDDFLDQVKHDTSLLEATFIRLDVEAVTAYSTAQLSEGLECVLKAIFYVLYQGAPSIELTPRAKLDLWMGCPGGYKGITSMTSFEILGGCFTPLPKAFLDYSSISEVKKVYFPPIDGRRPFPPNPLVMDILNYVRKVRNDKTHIDDTKKEVYLIDDDNCNYVTKISILSFLLLLDYHYDTLCEKMSRLKRPAARAGAPVDTEALAAHYFSNELPGSIVLQERWVLEKVFNKFCTSNHYRSTAIIPLQIAPFEASRGNEDEENEEYRDSTRDPYSFISEDSGSCYVILGDPGAGKSTLLAQLITRFSEEWEENPLSEDNMLPLRINLCYLDNESRNIREYVRKALFCLQDIESDVLRASVLQKLQETMEQGRILFFFDGINEIPGDTGNMLEKIFSFMRDFPKCKMVFTSRIKEFGEVAGLFRPDDLYKISEPTDQQIFDHIRQVIEVIERNRPAADAELDPETAGQLKTARIEHLYRCIEDDENLRNLARNPQHLSMIIDLLNQSAIEQSDYNNRGILYQTFVNRMLRSVGNEPGLLDRDLLGMLLMDFAWLQQDGAGRTKMKFIEFYCRDKSYLGFDAGRLSKTLDKLCSVNLLTLNNDQVIRFAHDSYNEYFQALTFVEKYTDPQEKETLLDEFDVASTAHIEIVKMAMELMEQRENGAALTFELARLILAKGSAGGSNGSFGKDGAGKIVLRLERKPAVNKHLFTLIQLVCGLNTFKEGKLKECKGTGFNYYSAGRNAYFLVEDMIRNIFRLSEQLSFDLGCEDDRKYLTDLFELACRMGTYSSLELLFQPVWRQYWLMLPEEFARYAAFTGSTHTMDTQPWYGNNSKDNFSRKKIGIFISQLHHTIRRTCSDYQRLFHLLDKQFAHAECLVIPTQLSIIGKFARALLLFLSVEKPKELVALYKKCSLIRNPSSFIRQYRNIALLLTDDPEYITRHFERHVPELVISGMVLTRLLARYESPVMQKFLFEKAVFDSISSKGKVFRYFIYRGYYLPDLMQLITEQYFRLKGNERKEIEDVLDLLPLEKIPKEIIQDRNHYDLNIYQSIREAAEKEDTVQGGIGYRIVYVKPDRIGLWIPEIALPDTCRYVLMPYPTRTACRHRLLLQSVVQARPGRFRIKSRDGALLPLQGVLTFPAEGDDAVDLEYAASKSNNDGLYLELTDKGQQRLLRNAYTTRTPFLADGVSCLIEEEPVLPDLERMQIVEVERLAGDLPAYRGEILFYADSEAPRPVTVNQAIRTPLLMQARLFKAASCNLAEAPRFSLLGYDNQTRMLVTEPFTDDYRPEGLYCLLSGAEGRYYIRDYSAGLKGYFELTFEADFRSKLQICGLIGWDDPGEPAIPYCFVKQHNNKYILRINDWESIVKLKNPNFVDKMFACPVFTVGRLSLHLEAVEWVEGNNKLAVLSVLPVTRKAEEVPFGGFIDFYKDRAVQIPVKPPLKLNLRNQPNYLPTVYFGCDAKAHPLAVVPRDVQIHPNQYIFLRGRGLRYRVLTSGTNFEAGATFVLKPKSGEFPAFGHLVTAAWQGERLAFHAQPVTSKGYVSLMVFTVRKNLITPETIDEILSAGYCLVEESGVEMEIENVSNCRLLEGPFTSFQIQKDDDFVLPAYNDLAIQNYWPVINNFDKLLFSTPADTHFYQTDHVVYVSNERHLSILIPRPSTNIQSLYLKLDERAFTFETTEISPEVQADFDSEWFMALELSAVGAGDLTYTPNIPSTGPVFFYRDAALEKPAKVGFTLLSHLIESASPYKYHSSICTYLLEENRRFNQLSEGWVDFFRQKNSIYLLIEYIQQHTDFARELQQKQLKLPIYQVLRSDSTQISLYSPADDKLLVSTDCSCLYEPNTLVCMENNYKLTLVTDPPQSPLFQFLYGVVVKNRPEHGDCWIRTNMKRNGKWRNPEFYYHYSDTGYQPSEGDWVCFFPGRNIRNTFGKIALYLSFNGSLVRDGAVITVVTTDYYNDGALEFTIGDRDDPEQKPVRTVVHPSQETLWRKVKDLCPGDGCRYYRESNNLNNISGHFYFSEDDTHA